MTTRRIESLDSYLFHQLAQAKKDSKRKLIDLGAGDPDLFPPERIVERLKKEAGKPENHRHPVYEGLPELKEAIAEWFYKRFKIKLDPEKEVLVLAGSKEGLGLSSWAFLNRGEEALIPDPSYPVYRRSVLLCCGKVVFYQLTEEKDWLLDLGKIKVTPKTRLLYLNYPHNPTGAVLGLDFLERIYEFARKQKLVILNDMAYSEITYDGYITPSLLQIRGAKDLCLEFFSFSKAYSMSGWRLGFAVGNKNLIDALFKVKVTSNSGVFHPIQKAGIEALSLPPKELLKIKDTYRKRRDILVDGLMKLGWEIRRSKGTIFCWAKIPGSAKFMDSKRFCLNLIKKGGVLTTPGAGFGKSGEGYVRFSLTSEVRNIKLALKRIKEIQF
jgi:LL-diaminopimelate aminotransferase